MDASVANINLQLKEEVIRLRKQISDDKKKHQEHINNAEEMKRELDVMKKNFELVSKHYHQSHQKELEDLRRKHEEELRSVRQEFNERIIYACKITS